MTNRQWHTAAPAPPQRQQENLIPQGNTILGQDPKYQDKLVSLIRLLHKHGNPQSTARGQDSDLTLLMDYENTYGNGPQTRSFAAHPERHAYKMMAALATGDDVRAWLAEWRHRGLDLGPFDKVDFFAPDALVVHQPDGMTRHLHATAAGGNRGRPRILANGLVDPYWGTGLDPAHVSGFVAPYRSALAPYMACCGQELGKNGEIPPGCWIPLEAGQPSGQLVPYQVWFQQMKAADIWQSIVSGTASASFVAATETGTAFLDRAYYRELDRQIRALVATVVPAIVAAHTSILNAKFPAGASVARQLAPGIREQIHELVSLVDQYNAPQIGQCFFPTLVDDTFIDERVAFIGQGRNLDAEGALIIEKEIRPGFFLPRIRAFGQLKNVHKRLRSRPEDDEDLVEVRLAIEGILNEMYDVKRIITILEDISKLVGQIQDEIHSNGVFSNVLEKKRVDEITIVFKNEANKGLPGFVDAYNQWWDHPSEVAPILQFEDSYYDRDLETICDTNAVFEKTGVDVKKEKMVDPGQVVEMLMNVRDVYLQKRPVEENDFLKQIYAPPLPLDQLPEAVEHYAHFAAARPAMEKAMPVLAKNLEYVEKQLLDRAKTARTELARRIMAEEQERSRRDAELARRAAEEEGRKNAVIVRLDIRKADHVDISDWAIPRALTYNDQSCTYDSLFGALFAVPNQWLRDRILEANIIPRNPECNEGNAKAIDKQIITFIHWFENDRDDESIRRFTDVCNDRLVWTECLPTGPEEEKGQKFGSPVSLLSQLIRFYDLDFGYTSLFQNYNQPWNPQPHDRYQSLLQPTTITQMFAVHTETQGFSQTITYDVPLVYGEFTLLSAIIYMSGHWHACVRHPGTGIWYRLVDSGVAYPLGREAIPKEITSPTRSDPERQADRGTGYKGSESALYEPRTWFYVRTSSLKPFVSKLQLRVDYNSLSLDDWQPGHRSQVDLLALFGGQQNPNRTYGPPWGGQNLFYGILQVLLRGPGEFSPEIRNGLRSILVVQDSSIQIPEDFVSFLNDVAIERFLRPLVEEGTIGKSIVLTGEVKSRLLPWIIETTKMASLNPEGKVQVVRWGKDAAQDGPYLKAITENPEDALKEVATLWALALTLLFIELMDDKTWNPSDLGKRIDDLMEDIADISEELSNFVVLHLSTRGKKASPVESRERQKKPEPELEPESESEPEEPEEPEPELEPESESEPEEPEEPEQGGKWKEYKKGTVIPGASKVAPADGMYLSVVGEDNPKKKWKPYPAGSFAPGKVRVPAGGGYVYVFPRKKKR
jgi:hypothetical protein